MYNLAISNQQAINRFLVIILALAVIVILVLILGSKKSRFRKFMSFLIEDESSAPTHQRYLNNMHRGTKTPRTELVILVQKIDERRRVTDSREHFRLFNEYYELVFRTRKGEAIHIITSKSIYRDVPFNQQGSLTFLRDEFIKFRTSSQVIENPKRTVK